MRGVGCYIRAQDGAGKGVDSEGGEKTNKKETGKELAATGALWCQAKSSLFSLSGPTLSNTWKRGAGRVPSSLGARVNIRGHPLPPGAWGHLPLGHVGDGSSGGGGLSTSHLQGPCRLSVGWGPWSPQPLPSDPALWGSDAIQATWRMGGHP